MVLVLNNDSFGKLFLKVFDFDLLGVVQLHHESLGLWYLQNADFFLALKPVVLLFHIFVHYKNLMRGFTLLDLAGEFLLITTVGHFGLVQEVYHSVGRLQRHRLVRQVLQVGDVVLSDTLHELGLALSFKRELLAHQPFCLVLGRGHRCGKFGPHIRRNFQLAAHGLNIPVCTKSPITKIPLLSTDLSARVFELFCCLSLLFGMMSLWVLTLVVKTPEQSSTEPY